MGVKKLRPVTPGQRFKIKNTFDEITTDKPEKSLLKGITKSGGRNNTGKMTMKYRGGGHKRKYRIIDFKRNKTGVAEVKSVEYDPNRSAFIALIEYNDGTKSYIVAPKGISVGDKIESGEKVLPEIGNCLYMENMPLGSTIHNLEIHPGKGAQVCRSAGSSAKLVAKEGKYVNIKMPSGETRLFLGKCKATIGIVSNPDHSLERSGKAGRTRWLGRRPRTRPAAMNPVDHPQGGGEGRSKGGLARNINGIPAKGFKTRKKKKYSNRLIIERKKKK